ncbi:MAG: KpsF/GutQ family sugar-phosphate isomerase [Terriglobales bacterium]
MLADSAKRVLEIEAAAVRALVERVDERFERAVALMRECRGRVVVSGMGKSGLVARKIAATLSSTGTPALFLHPAEARHGDLGMLAAGDVVLALSYSGDTEELLDLVGPIRRLGIGLIAMTGTPDSPLARAAETVLDVSVAEEACGLGLAPTASTTAALAMGDALAMALAEAKGFSAAHFAALHPGGKLGKRLTPIADLMHRGEALPTVGLKAPLPDVLYEMSRKGFGLTGVLDAAGRLAGVISDGDLRRLLERNGARALELAAEAYMTRQPLTIAASELAPAALRIMEQRKVTALMVTDGEGRLAGLIHLHDLWTTQLL